MLLAFPFVIVTAVLVPDAIRIDGLIEQLGSEVFAEREAATKALDRIGVLALEPLRRASEISDDAEIRRRAERLVKVLEQRTIKERALAIRQSQLSPEEKSQKLKPLLWEGMTGEDVHRLLGRPITVLSLHGPASDYYPQYSLSIYYNRDLKVESIR